MRIVIALFLVFVSLALLAVLSIFISAWVRMLNRPLKNLYAERSSQQDFCPYSEIPEKLISFMLLTEDIHFFEHSGYRTAAIKGAFRLNRRSGRIITGGSTITQQLAKNLYFHFRKSYLRKAIELIIAIQAERKLGKEKIMELYLNIIYFGNGIYGISDAARFYFEKNVNELSDNQMFILACIPSAPTAGNPVQHPEKFVRIRNKVLAREERKKINVPEEVFESISFYNAECLDPELRKNEGETAGFPQTIVMLNERFGPFGEIRGEYIEA